VIRISWPLGLLLAFCVAIVARNPRLARPVLLVLAVWLVWQLAFRSGGRRPR
jgi:hypothetical protein